MFLLNWFGRIMVPGSTVIAIGLKPNFFAKISEKLLSTPPESATTASTFSDSSNSFSLKYVSKLKEF